MAVSALSAEVVAASLDILEAFLSPAVPLLASSDLSCAYRDFLASRYASPRAAVAAAAAAAALSPPAVASLAL